MSHCEASVLLVDVGLSVLSKTCVGSVFYIQLSLKYVCVMMSIFLYEGDRPADEVSQRQDIQMTHCGSRFFGRPVLGIRRHWALNP